ncbi:WD40 repeat domain-containing protein, partial [Rhizobium sp. S95]|uniref:WD40 repeat domain-containing protein n=1 Tax=Ciceribacter sichuanensis TaxID=2949647 RepID=A0AAJ1C1I9_9HYPH|nr:WD40 repeat domain-containing protein [Ciceribacter sp. S95]MCO5960099.1 WD40 repeat domain-containing protein [Ciceribacter sp. S101]
MKLEAVAKDFENDAKHIKKKKENLNALQSLVRGLHGKDSAAKQKTYRQIRLIKDDFAPEHVESLRDDDQGLYEYLRDGCTKKTSPWTIPVLLGWLAYYHQREATQFYNSCGLPFRLYPKTPGGNAKAKKRSGPIMPVELPERKSAQEAHTSTISVSAPIRLPHASSVMCVQFSARGDRIVTATKSGEIAVWPTHNLSASSSRLEIATYPNSPAYGCFSPNGEMIASVAWDDAGGLQNSNIENGPQYPRFGHDYRATTVSFSPNGERAITAAWDGHIRVWSTKDGQLGRIDIHRSQSIAATRWMTPLK